MIFSGDESRKLWDAINEIKNLHLHKDFSFPLWEVVYLLACKCQELEGKLEETLKK